MSKPASQLPLAFKTLDCELKSIDDDGSFELYAAAFNNQDRQGDIIVPGAVKNLDELLHDGWGAINHRGDHLPTSYPTAASQDAKGLLIAGKFHSTPKAQELRTVVKERKAAGKSVKCSIGYSVDDYEIEKRGGRTVRLLKAIRVYEFSFVNLPANPEAEVVSAKGLGASPLEPEPDEMSETEKGLIAAIKRAVGIDAKRSVPISAANRAKIGEHLQAVEEAHDEHDKCIKEMGECHKKCMKAHKCSMKALDEMKSCMKGFEPTTTDEDEEDEVGSPMGRDAQGDEEEPRRRKPKSEPTQEQKDLAAYRAQLKGRAVAGRATAVCP